MKTYIASLVFVLTLIPALVSAQSAAKVTSKTAKDMVWKELAPGLSMTPLWQASTGKDTAMLLKFAPGYKGIKHGHSNAYHGVTLQGTWVHIDNDETGHVLPKGSFAHQPAKVPHSDNCISKIPCIIMVHLNGKYDFFLPK